MVEIGEELLEAQGHSMMKQTNSIEAALAFKERVHAWAVKVRVKPKQVRLQAMRRKWASCSTEGRVTFSLDLLERQVRFRIT